MRFIRVSICVLMTFAVLAFGAVETWSQSVLEIGAALLFLWWGFLMATGRGEEIRWSPVIWPLLGLELIALLQYLVPLSVYPYLTKLELLRFTSYLILLFLFGSGVPNTPTVARFGLVSGLVGICRGRFRRASGSYI